MSLNESALKYPSDKHIQYGHNYIPGYTDLFDGIRKDVRNVLEIGIGCLDHEAMMQRTWPSYKSGNSLRMWKDYFNNANVYGIDIHPAGMISGEDRITTIVADQSSRGDLLRVVSSVGSTLDVVIDDGSHRADHQVFSFEVLRHFMTIGGIYVIEDIQPPYIEAFKSLSIFPESVRKDIRANFSFRVYDTRDTGKADDILICFSRVR